MLGLKIFLTHIYDLAVIKGQQLLCEISTADFADIIQKVS